MAGGLTALMIVRSRGWFERASKSPVWSY